MGTKKQIKPEAYCGMTATETNPGRDGVPLKITTPSGKTFTISSRLVVIDQNHEGGCIADHMEADGVPFFRTMIMNRHLVKEVKSSSTV